MIGEAVGGFRIISEIGRGGMGVVYLAEHQVLPRKACVKVLLRELSDRQDVVDRFLREARAACMIDHPGIVRVFDCGQHPSGHLYILMELLEGESLRGLLDRTGALPVEQAVALGAGIADALAAAHGRGVIHRDLKPENIFVLGNPAGAIKVLDFGVAKLTDGPGSLSRTRAGTLLGTPQYMSPEQCRGAGETDFRSDIYALGCMLFELLVGRPPFGGAELVQLVVAHLHEPAPPLSTLVAGVPAAIESLVARMLAKSKDARPASMKEVAAELGAQAGKRRTSAAVTVMAPPRQSPTPARAGAQAKTTLSQSAFEIELDPEEKALVGGRRPRALWGAAGVAGLVAVIAVVMFARAGHQGAAPGVPPAPSAARANGSAGAAPAASSPEAMLPAPSPAAPVPAPAPARPPATLPALPARTLPPPPAAGRPTPTAPGAPAAPAGSGGSPRQALASIVISSPAPDSVVCRVSDGRRLGPAGSPLALPAGRPLRLVVYSQGYRSREITVTPQEGLTRAVKLERLSLDELEEMSPCRD
jgi:serine/threonine-protein kinase